MSGKVEARIIELLYRAVPASLTIREISMRLGKAYPHIHKVVTSLLSEQVLRKEIVGNAYACSLDLDNEKCRAYCAILEHDASRAYRKRYKIPLSTVAEVMRMRDAGEARAAWMRKTSLVILVERETPASFPAGSVILSAQSDRVPLAYFRDEHVVLFGAIPFIEAYAKSVRAADPMRADVHGGVP